VDSLRYTVIQTKFVFLLKTFINIVEMSMTWYTNFLDVLPQGKGKKHNKIENGYLSQNLIARIFTMAQW